MMHLSKPIECTPRVTPDVSSGPWGMTMCQPGLISHSLETYRSPWGCGERGGCAYMESEGLWEISILFPQFCCEPKTTLEKNDGNVIYEANTGLMLGLRM